VKVLSATDEVQIVAKDEILLTAGGGYIRLKGGDIEIHAPGMIDVKGAQHSFQGPTRLDANHPDFQNLPSQPLTIFTAASPASSTFALAGMPYRLYADGALIKQGVIDRTGTLPIDHKIPTQQYRLELANGVTHHIPVAGEYTGDSANGQLANQGFQFHQSAPDDGSPEVDRAVHRQDYNNLLNPSSDA
jgi:type VI secretion system secreted protein VgrG